MQCGKGLSILENEHAIHSQCISLWLLRNKYCLPDLHRRRVSGFSELEVRAVLAGFSFEDPRIPKCHLGQDLVRRLWGRDSSLQVRGL